MKKKFNTKSTINLTKEILSILANGFWTPIDVFLSTPYKGVNYRKIYVRLHQLSKAKCAYKMKKHNKLFYKLTPVGEQKVAFLKVKEKLNNSQKWDGKWRVLIFDVPENKKGRREFLRKKLRELDFLRLQDSVWLTPYPIGKEFEEFIQFFGLKNFVRCLVVESMDYDLDLRKKFNLNN